MRLNIYHLPLDETEPDYAKDVKFVLAELTKLLPHLRELTIVSDWMVTLGMPFEPVVEQIKKLKYLRDLTILQQCNAADDNIGVVLADVMAELPLLKCLKLNEWDYMSSGRHHRIPISGIHQRWTDLRSRQPSRFLDDVEIVVGDKTSLSFVEWLFRPFRSRSTLVRYG
jgi:hypothetical protein